MRVGINAHLLGKGAGYRLAGVSHYVERLVLGLPGVLEPGDEIVVYAPRGVAKGTTTGVRWRLSRLPTDRPPVRIGWEQTVLPLWSAVDRLDVLHSPVNVLPRASPAPGVLTIHDLSFLRLPDRLSASRRRYLSVAARTSARHARRIIAVSESTRDDVVELLGVPPERVTVIPLAADERYRPADEMAIGAFRARKNLAEPFVLFVGTLEPRKNVSTLLRAFAALSKEIPHKLVLVGAQGWMTAEMYETLQRLGLADRVRLTGFVPVEELPLWYSAADVFAFPSSYEGFGLPPLEAMACGAAVITSAVSSLPEVVGDAAVIVPPGDVDELAGALRRVLADPKLRADLGRKGIVRAGLFSWERMAQQTAQVYRDVLETG